MLLCTAMNRLYLTALYCTFLAACDPPPPFSLQCVRFGHPKATAALKKQFAVSDKRFYWLKVTFCCTAEEAVCCQRQGLLLAQGDFLLYC